MATLTGNLAGHGTEAVANIHQGATIVVSTFPHTPFVERDWLPIGLYEVVLAAKLRVDLIGPYVAPLLLKRLPVPILVRSI